MIGFLTAAFAMLGGIAWLVVRAWLPWITRDPDGRWRLGSRERFRQGRATLLRRAQAIIVREGEEVIALSAICTHERCTLHETPARKEITCPCHGAAFDYQGRVLRGPAEVDLPRLLLSEEDGELLLDVSRRLR